MSTDTSTTTVTRKRRVQRRDTGGGSALLADVDKLVKQLTKENKELKRTVARLEAGGGQGRSGEGPALERLRKRLAKAVVGVAGRASGPTRRKASTPRTRRPRQAVAVADRVESHDDAAAAREDVVYEGES